MAANREDYITIARVLSEDDKFLILEVPKDLKEKITLQEDDRFLTMMFVRKNGDKIIAWYPWESDE